MKKSILAGIVALALDGTMVNLPATAAPAAVQGQHHHGRRHGQGHYGAALEKLHEDLHLNARQEHDWQRIRIHQHALRHLMLERRQHVRQIMNAELAKAQPNMARIVAAQDQGQNKLRARRRALRSEMLAFYARLLPQQKTVVRDALVAHRNRMREWRQSHWHRHGSPEAHSGKAQRQELTPGNAQGQPQEQSRSQLQAQ